jgi:stage II sporulation protein D
LRGFAIVVLAALTAHACAERMTRPRVGGPSPGFVRVDVSGVVERVPVEEYVRVAILSELGPRRGDPGLIERILEVQAIVSRTYARLPRHASQGFDFCSTTHCQLYDSRRRSAPAWASAVTDAVHRTSGKVLWFAGQPARVAFHADCGGHTSAARDVWRGDAVPYLAAAADDGPAAGAHAAWRFAPADAALLAALNADERTRVGSHLTRIDVLRRDTGGRADLVALGGERSPVVRGEELRMTLARAFGPRALRSTSFTVVRTERGFEFTGRGFGHGVGLCQAGALARVAAGSSAEQVLTHYFPGTTIR